VTRRQGRDAAQLGAAGLFFLFGLLLILEGLT
jgi:hypothetical protein